MLTLDHKTWRRNYGKGNLGIDKQINHPKQFRKDRLKTIRLAAAARLTRANATARII